MKKILVTGAAGFIGFHLSKRLGLRGDKVIGYDNFNDYYSRKLKNARAVQLQKLGIPVIDGDVCDKDLLNSIIRKEQITHIVHLAAQAGVRYSLTNPHAYLTANIEGFLNILEICRSIPSLKLTYASSSSVYGLNRKTPFSITDKTDQQASLYGMTKKSNELMAQTYHHLFGIPVTGLRFFTVYGPWGRPDMAYYSFAEAILKAKPIDIYNHGKLKRDFTYIDDIVEGTVAAIDLESSCEIFNLGNSEPVELIRFVEIIENALGKKAIKNFLPMQQGDVFETYADIDYSKEKLHYDPKTSLEKGIGAFVKWLRKYQAEDNKCHSQLI